MTIAPTQTRTSSSAELKKRAKAMIATANKLEWTEEDRARQLAESALKVCDEFAPVTAKAARYDEAIALLKNIDELINDGRLAEAVKIASNNTSVSDYRFHTLALGMGAMVDSIKKFIAASPRLEPETEIENRQALAAEDGGE